MPKRLSAAAITVAVILMPGCSSWSGPASGPAGYTVPDVSRIPLHTRFSNGAIQHIIVVVQENRTVDNLFNGYPGANTVTSGMNSHGKSIALQPIALAAPYDISHKHAAWVRDYDHGRLDGFNLEGENCFVSGKCPPRNVAAYGYVPKNEVQPYWDLAQQYTFANNMFESNQGPSFPAHQYIISGTSTISNISDLKAAENPVDPQNRRRQGGCDSLRDATVLTIDPAGIQGHPVYPCFNRISIMQLMNDQDVGWRYYQEFGGSGEWHAVDAIKNIWEGPTYANVVWPSSKILRDIKRGQLQQVSFVTPSALDSDHSGRTNGSGPSWVASIVNTVGKSSYWQSTAIIVTWDDWGGWYDHVSPTIYNSYENGFRVPMLVISPYAKSGYISTVKYEFGSILKFIEETFGLDSLGTTDERANDLSDCFTFRALPRAFKPIKTEYSATYFEHLPIDYRSPDDDF